MTRKTMSLGDAAVRVLTEAGEPLHYREITRRILDQGLADSGSRTPDASVNAVIVVELKRGKASRFERVRPGEYGLRSWQPADALTDSETDDEAGESEHRVRVPLYPLYSEMRLLLPIWAGKPRAHVTHLRTTIAALRGTPQSTVDWSNPDEWIVERLSGDDRALALAVWTGSGKRVNPRHVYGHWLLARTYGLLDEDPEGILHLSERGRDFVDHPGGEVEAFLDEREGLLKLIALVAAHGPARVGELTDDWAEHLSACSGFGSDSTIKDTLRRRLRNLLDRELIARSSAQYTVTDAGLAYLQRVGGEDTTGTTEQQELLALAKQQNASIREAALELLRSMDPIALEHLVKRLLEEMKYDNVEVTAPSNDKGVDVIGDIELGITSVREVIQVKRHRRTIQRKDLDALRGSLHRFNAVRGTIITTGDFSRGTREAAFEPGAAPITLINGEKFLSLLLEHGIGIKKFPIDILTIDHAAFVKDDPSED